jgi:hypothetical protein
VEIALLSTQKQPVTVSGWFALLQDRPLLGLAYLNLLDLVNYLMIGVMLLALFMAFRRVNPGGMVIAAVLGLLGVAVGMSTNTALSMLALSGQYSAAISLDQQNLILGAGQALLAVNRFSSAGAHPGSGGYVSLLLVALAGLMVSSIMLKGRVFRRHTAYVGILANTLDLAYCAGYLVAPVGARAVLAVMFIPAAGLLFMVWHILVGWGLLKLTKV